ncbi:MAG: nicotinamidase [Desulfosalsimonas sp.]
MTEYAEKLKHGDALLIIDLQNDFCPGGALPIEKGDEVVYVLNRWIRAAVEKGVTVYASRDWHPVGHISFQGHGGGWPPHCIQDTQGAAFHKDLELQENTVVVTKGVRFDQDQNSAFDQTGLAEEFRRSGIQRVLVGGLALDVCVQATVLDALDEGFETVLLLSATRPVTAEGGKTAVEKMKQAGAVILEE